MFCEKVAAIEHGRGKFLECELIVDGEGASLPWMLSHEEQDRSDDRISDLSADGCTMPLYLRDDAVFTSLGAATGVHLDHAQH